MTMEEFPNTFAAEATTKTDENEFNPFGIGDDSATNGNGPSPTEGAAAEDSEPVVSEKAAVSLLPPKILVKFMVEEEVTSTAGRDGSSEVEIEGTVLAQVVSSDATKNIPFFVTPSTDNKVAVDFKPNETYAKKAESQNGAILNIPKEAVEFVNVGTYRISQYMQHMPLLLEQKVVRAKSKVQIAIQVRSKLSNLDDLSEFSIALFIPSKVNAKTVTVASGDGYFDEWKRCITWDKENLPKGQSFMVSATCELTDTAGDEDLNFPVMLRCRSEDQISSLQLTATAAEGHPASVSSSIVGKSYRIVHRLK